MIFVKEFSQIFQLFVNELPGFIQPSLSVFFKYFLVPVYCFLIYDIFPVF